jgi:MoxR-like ATPase
MSENKEIIQELNKKISDIKSYMHNFLIGQNKLINALFIGILSDGHILIEGMPGLGKTLAVKVFSELFNLNFSRIQFTPDLLPSDILGTVVYNQKTYEFETILGPIFSNIVLADEINRAPAKVQSALLQVMEEKQITIEKDTFKLDNPFIVLATQNPIDNSGTYKLPEAQMDRFFQKILIDYPSELEEIDILKLKNNENKEIVKKKFDIKIISYAKKVIENIIVDEKIYSYIVKIVNATRNPSFISKEFSEYINYGASTRGSISILKAAKINAFFKNRDFVIPDDVKEVLFDSLNHRLILSYEAEAEMISIKDILFEISSKIKI